MVALIFHKTMPIRMLRISLGVSFVLSVAIHTFAAGNQNAGKEGPYDLQVRGFLTGQGRANVAAKQVHIKADCKDDNGNTVSLNLHVRTDDKGRFAQVVSIGSDTLTIQGRIDPAGASVKTPRITCTYRTSGNQYGRIVGHR